MTMDTERTRAHLGDARVGKPATSLTPFFPQCFFFRAIVLRVRYARESFVREARKQANVGKAGEGEKEGQR